MAAEFRVFLSAVSSEFGAARDDLAADLRSRDTLVRVQSDFRQEADSDTTLKKLHDYIRDCSAVVCVIGTRSGACPPPVAAAPFREMLPSGISEASYTQWEFFFARHYERRLSIYIANPDYSPDRPAPTTADRPDLQQALVRHIVEEQGLDRSYFSNRGDLRAEVLKEDWPRKPPVKPILLPYPSIGTLFKGRATFIERVRESLTRAADGGLAVVATALYGLGGIGKTRAAVEYAWAFHEKYTALLFVIAETPEALLRNLAALAEKRYLNLPEQTEKEEGVRLRAVLDWLKTNRGWLLILDNIDTNAALEGAEKLIGQFARGHIVITSRLANFPADVDPLEVDVLDVGDAANFLLERTARLRRSAADDKATAREVAMDLGGLALALEHAGAYIVRHRASFRRYRELWQGSREKVISWSDPAVTHYPRAIAATWQTSVAQLADPARRLLERLAWLAPEPVPEFLLDVPIPEDEGEDLYEALADLAAYSLATRDPKEPRFLVHGLVQDVTRRSLDAAASQQRVIEALGWVNAGFEGDPEDVRNWPRLDPLASHAQSVSQSADIAGITAPTALLMNQLGVLFYTKSMYAQAEPLYRRVLAIDEASFGRDHPDVARDLNNLAELLRATNRLAQAEPLYRRALALGETSFGPDHPTVSIGLNNLALLLQATNRLADAEPLMRRALAIDEASFGPDHPNVALRLNNLAQLLHATNRLAEAEPLMRRALAIDQTSFGPDHPNVATRLSNLAQLLQDTDQLAEAESLMRRALAIGEASFGPDHPNVALCLNNLAQLLQATNRLAEAEPLMRRVLAIDEASFGPDHPNVARDLNNLAELLRSTNRMAEAEPLYRRALAILEGSFGPDHPNVASCLNNLALLLQATNRLADAEPLMQRMAAIFMDFVRATGHLHPDCDAAFRNYAGLLAAMGKSEAEIKAAIASLTG
jgi:tetratricopeptide (TPR) repeat protein